MRKYLIFLFLLLPGIALAEVTVSLNLQRTEAAFVDSVKMTVNVSGTRDAEDPVVKGFENFSVRTGGRSSRIEIINGKVSSSVEFIYYLQPKRIGIFEIGPASVKADGKAYQSNAVKLAVKDSVDEKGASNSPVFITANISAKTVFLEEQLEYTIRLYYNGEVSNLSLSLPELPGLAFKQTGKPAEYNTSYKSRNYRVVEVKYSLIPSKPGHFNINPARMSLIVHGTGGTGGEEDSDDAFSMDDFFSRARGKPVTIASNPLALDVLTLPESGKPADFSGLIGTYNMSSELSPARIKTGESATLTVIVKGNGNINRIPDIKIPDNANLKIYSDEPKLEYSADNAAGGSKTMKWAIVPIKEGIYTLPALSISYFDRNARMYRKIWTQPPNLIADHGTGVISESPFDKGKPRKGGKEEVEELGKDILPIHRSDIGSFRVSEGPVYFYMIIILFPAFVYGSLMGFKLIRERGSREERFKGPRAANILYKICRQNKDISAHDLSGALKNYFSARFDAGPGLTSQEISLTLKDKGCPAETISQAEWLLKKIETLIYTGKGSYPCDLQDEAVHVIKSIEKEIK